VHHRQIRPAYASHLVVRLHRVSIRPDELDGYRQWQAFLHARHAEAVATLAREHMLVEAMFRDKADPTTLFWLEVKDDQGATVESSDADIDIKHRQFMQRVLDPGTWSVMETDNVLVAPFIAGADCRTGTVSPLNSATGWRPVSMLSREPDPMRSQIRTILREREQCSKTL
jgi:hypothetical protein